MKKTELFSYLQEKEVFSVSEIIILKNGTEKLPFSIHWELRTLLYAGISSLSAGLGVLIYQNIDTIGHSVLIGIISLLCVGLFFYVFKNAKPFSWELVEDQEKFKDFALLGACITFLTLGGYLQYQYNLFGDKYGLATMIPAVVFFALAYRFDHRGVLAMAITSLASSVGLSITPTRIIQDNDFLSQELVVSAIILGIGLIFISIVLARCSMKKHFTFTYLFFGLNLAAIAGLAGLFNFDWKFIYGLVVLLLSIEAIWYARNSQSYLFMLLGVIYGYIVVTYLFIELMDFFDSFFIYEYYFLASAGGVIYFLINLKKLVKGKS